MRRAFDQAFAEAPPPPGAPAEGFLAVRMAGAPYALRLSEVAGLFKDRRLVPLPSPLAELRGLAGIRGTLVPVFDLAALLGHPAAGDLRWLVLAPLPDTLAFAFSAFEGLVRAAREEAAPARDAVRPHAGTAIRLRDRPCPVVDVPSLVASIRARARAEDISKER
jgi:purine-binding chemotaxis protein CheW